MAFLAERARSLRRERRRAPARGLRPPRRALGPPGRRADPQRAAAHPAHAHGEGGRDRSRRGAPRGRRASSRRPAHVPRTCAQGLLRRGAHRVLPAGRADARARLRRARRGQPGGAGRARRARGRAVREVRGDPARDSARGAARRPDRGLGLPAPVRHSVRRVRGRLGRAHDRSEGDGRRARDRARSRASAESTPCCAWSETVPTARVSSASRTSSESRGICYFVGYQSGCRRLLPAVRRVPAALGERGDSGQRDRVSRLGNAGRGEPRRRRSRRGARRRGRVPRRARRHRGCGGAARDARGAIRRCGRGSASRAARACSRATRSRGSSTTSTGSTARCWPPRASRKS